MTGAEWTGGRAANWRDDALCREVDPELFYPELGESAWEAKAVCARCESRGPCLEFAIEHDLGFGIFAGTSPRQREQLRRERRADAHNGDLGDAA